MKYLALVFAAVSIFPRCGDRHQSDGVSIHYTHQPLKEFQDTLSEIPSGTAVRIAGYSGYDVDQKNDALHYCQFVVVDQHTGDTFRVLATVINVEGSGSGADTTPTLTPATIYSGDKGVQEATFIVPTNDQKMLIRSIPDLMGNDTARKKPAFSSGGDSTNFRELVEIPEGVPFFTRHYKTAVGILSFKQQPW